MEALEQEVKDLQLGLEAVVQALNFIQTFLESDYGLKFQFHAYRTAPVYARNSDLLESLRTKYGQGHAIDQFQKDKIFPQDRTNSNSNSSYSHNNESIPYYAQESRLEADITSGAIPIPSGSSPSSSSSNSSMTITQTFAPLCDSGESQPEDPTQSDHDNRPPITGNLHQVFETKTVNDKSATMVHQIDIPVFNISDLVSMKQEDTTPHEIYHDEGDDGELETFNSDADDENEGENDEGESMEDHISSEEIRVDVDIAERTDASQFEVETKFEQNMTQHPEEIRQAPTVSQRRPKKRKAADVESQFKCLHCRRRCQDQAALELHMTHHKQQCQCSQCGIWLADKSVLNRHMRVHTGARPFSCEFCNESFSRQDIAKKHTQRKHKDMLINK